MPENYILPQSVRDQVLETAKPGRYAEAYRQLANALEGHVDQRVVVWLRGAADVNEGVGVYGQFIRSYTEKQYLARFGESAGSKIQDSSDKIAYNVFEELNSNGSIPTIGELVSKDAGPAAEILFKGDAAGWAGNPLFLAFGVTEPLAQNILSKHDGYDALAMIKFASNTANVFGDLKGAWDALTSNAPPDLPNAAATIASGAVVTNEFLQSLYGGSFNYALALAFDQSIALGTVNADNLVRSNLTYALAAGKGDDLIQSGLNLGIVDGGEGRDTLDFTGSNLGVYFGSGFAIERTLGLLLSGTGGRKELGVIYKNVEALVGTSGNDVFNDQTFRGSDVYLGDGDDLLIAAHAGTEVHLGTGGSDTVIWNAGVGVSDFDFKDRLTFAGIELHGGLKNKASVQKYAVSYGGLVKWGLNEQGDLIVHIGPGDPEKSGNNMYFQGWANSQRPQGSGGAMVGPGNIVLAEYDISAHRLFENWQGQGSYWGTWELFGLIVKTVTGTSAWNGKDPLVLDLDGDGFDLTGRSSTSPMYDVDADLYAERTGWVGRDDGILVRDINKDGVVNDAREMFGARGSGFEQLATLDGNHDGVVNAADNGLADFDGDGQIDAEDTFGVLKVWRDLDQDGKVDPGELKGLADYGIVGLQVNSAPSTQSIAGNLVAATANFVRADGSTGLIGEAVLNLDNQNTVYQGAPITVSAAAAARPDLKGAGTLVSLREALSMDASGLGRVDQTLSALNADTGHTPEAIRTAIRPLLSAWAQGSPVRLGDGRVVTGAEGLAQYADVPVVRKDGAVADYAWRIQDAKILIDGASKHVGTWEFATGLKVTVTVAENADLPSLAGVRAALGAPSSVTSETYQADGKSYVRTTYAFAGGEKLVAEAEVQAQASTPTLEALLGGGGTITGHVYTVDKALGSDLAFFERYLGEVLPFHQKPVDVTAALQAMDTAIANMERGLDLIGVRVAVQSPAFGAVFEGLRYDAASNSFKPTTSQQLAPTFGNLLEIAATKTDPQAWLLSWKPIIDIVLGDYNSGDGQINTYGFLAQNIVAAFEAVHPSFGFMTAVKGLGLDPSLFVTGPGAMAGTDEADIFYLDAADQTARGGLGMDNYVIGERFGHDVIDDVEDALRPQVEDIVRFTKHLPGDLVATRDGVDLILTATATGDTLRIVGQFYGEWDGPGGSGYWPDKGVGAIIFADGTVWDQIDIAQAVSRVDAGSTTLIGTADNDVLDGGAGDDRLEGAGDGDVYWFRQGYGHDVVFDVEDNTYRQSFDVLSFGDGIARQDLSFSRDGASDDLLITLTSGDSVKIEGQFAATYTGTLGVWWMNRIELLYFTDGDYISADDLFNIVLAKYQTAGADFIYGFDREDVLDGGTGDDFLSGGNENDTYIFGRGYGHDQIADRADNLLSGQSDTVRFKADIAFADTRFARDGNDLVITIQGAEDGLRIKDHYVVTETGPFGDQAFSRIETFVWSDGTTRTWGQIELAVLNASMTSGDDHVVGTHYDDYIDALGGNDLLEGSDGSDTYVFGGGYGRDQINDLATSLLEDSDTVLFKSDVSPSDVRIERYGDNLQNAKLTIGANDSLSIIGQFFYTSLNVRPGQIETFKFSDGTTWTASDLRLRYIQQHQTAQNDTIDGFWTNDTIEGGAGDDVLRGGDGSDTYRFSVGFGHDVIEESVSIVSIEDQDKIVFGTGLVSTDAQLIRSGDDLTIAFASSGDSVLIKGQFTRTTTGDGWQDIELVSFADGVTWTAAQMQAMALGQSMTTGDDHIIGFNTDETFDPLSGDDIIEGKGGGDTYIFGRGYGHDQIIESVNTVYDDRPDTVSFKSDIAPADLRFIKVGDDLRIEVIGAGDTLTVVGQFYSTDYNDIERFAFSDGTVLSSNEVEVLAIASLKTSGDDVIIGTKRDNVLDGGAGNDRLEGGDGRDTYRFDVGYGRDVVYDYDSSSTSLDKVVFGPGITAANLSGTRQGDDLVLKVIGHDDVLTVRNYFGLSYYLIEQFVFADGAVWAKPEITTLLYGVANPLVGTAYSDTINGTSGDDVIVALDGADTLTGGDGGDVYFLGRGDKVIVETASNGGQDIVRLEAASSNQVSVTRSGDDARIVYANGSTKLTGQFAATAVEKIIFNDGVTWTLEDLRAAYLAAAATSSADTIIGFDDRADTLAGGAGDDWLGGRTGGDTYLIGGANNGRDTISDLGDQASTDRLVFAAGIVPGDVQFLTNSPASGDLLLKVGTIEVVLKGQMLTDGSGVEQVVFADGSTWDRATLIAKATAPIVNQTITGTSGPDTLSGGTGNDTLSGLGGSDTYLYSLGGGVDTIYEGPTSGTDRLVFGAGILASDIIVSRSASSGATLSFAGQAGKVVLDTQFYGSGWGVEQFVFADGTTWTEADLKAAYLSRVQTSGADVILGFDNSADTLQGGLGNDVLYGYSGSDSYIYNLGDGVDTIYEGPASGTDRLVFGAGIAASDILVSRSASSGATLSFAGQAGKVVLDTQFAGSGWGVEQLVFADGTTWTEANLRAAYLAQVQTSGADVILGFDNSGETLQGGLGNDVLYGYAGSDSYIYNLGDGIDTIYEGPASGTDRLMFGAGILASDIIVSRSTSTGATISFAGQAGQVKLDTQFWGSGYGVEQVVFADGTTWTEANLKAAYLAKAQTSGADVILGFENAAETLQGGLGNDTLYGYSGSDSYIYNLGDGVDTIYEGPASGTDRLVFGAGITVSDILVTRSGDHATISFANSPGSIKLDTQFYGSGYGVEQIVFADGTIWSQTNILNAAWIRGDANANTLTGTASADKIDGGGGNDTIDAGGGADRILGGAGNDTLTGGSGADTFVFQAGFGKDTVKDFKHSEGDKIEVKGLFADLGEVQSHSQQVGADVLITYDADNTILLKTVTLSTLTADDFIFA